MSMVGELLVDYANELKRIFGQEIFVLGYSNDYMVYVPSARVIEEGGPEASPPEFIRDFNSSWHPNIEITILRGIVKLAEQTGVTSPSRLD